MLSILGSRAPQPPAHSPGSEATRFWQSRNSWWCRACSLVTLPRSREPAYCCLVTGAAHLVPSRALGIAMVGELHPSPPRAGSDQRPCTQVLPATLSLSSLPGGASASVFHTQRPPNLGKMRTLPDMMLHPTPSFPQSETQESFLGEQGLEKRAGKLRHGIFSFADQETNGK